MTLRNPAVLARTALTVAELSGGRLELGVGSGGAAFDHELAGVTELGRRQERASLFSGVGRAAGRAARRTSGSSRRRDVPLTVAGRGETILGGRGAACDPLEHVRRHGADAGGGRPAGPRGQRAASTSCARRRGAASLRSALIGYPFVGETPWRSDDAFADFAGRWGEAGFEELIVYYPPETGMPRGSVAPGVFERAFAAQG